MQSYRTNPRRQPTPREKAIWRAERIVNRIIDKILDRGGFIDGGSIVDFFVEVKADELRKVGLLP